MKPLGAARLSVFLCRCAYGICALLILLVGWQTLSHRPELLDRLLWGLVCALAAAFLLWLAGEASQRLGWKIALAGLLTLCLALRLYWVFHAQIQPLGDYQVFHATASALAAGGTLQGDRYLALFPHIMGYSWFLSLFYKAFGPSPLLAAVINALLSTLSCALLFLLARRLGGVKLATGAGLVWTFFPSQIVYNMFVLSEPLYTALILGVLLAAARFDAGADAPAPTGALALGALAGLLAAAVNLCRPVGVILLLALFLWLGPVRLERWRDRAFRRNALLFLLALVGLYLLAGRLGSGYLDRRLGTQSASTPGYNVLVGFNAQSGGRWNQEDSDLLFAIDALPGSTASSTQAQMLELAKARVTSGTIDFPRLFGDKLYHLMGRDDACVDYAATVLSRTRLLSDLCDIYWYASLFLALAGTIRAMRRGDRGGLFPAMLYFVGLILAHMLVEVAGRYHYSLLVPISLLAAWGAEGPRALAARLHSRFSGSGRSISPSSSS